METNSADEVKKLKYLRKKKRFGKKWLNFGELEVLDLKKNEKYQNFVFQIFFGMQLADFLRLFIL